MAKSPNVLRTTKRIWASLECHRSIFWGMGKGLKATIWNVGDLGHQEASDQANGGQYRHIHGQGLPGVPQVHLLGHGEGLEG